MGAASFSIYLFHEAMLFAMRNLGWVVPNADMLNAALMCVISLAIPVAFHFAVEKKLNIWSKKELLGVLAGYQVKYPKLKG
jgi:peptidoglycan/LPS O-acetylase OafA/YrhL